MKLMPELELSFDCNQGAIRKVLYNAEGEYCLTCGSDKTIKLWNPRKKLLLKTYSGHGSEVMSADCSCDSSQIVSGSGDKTVIIWDVVTGQPLRRYRAHFGVVNCVCFNEDSSVFLSASIDGTIKIWDNKSNSREPIQVLDEAKDSITHFTITDHEIASVSLDRHVRRYDIRKGLMEADCLYRPLTYISYTNDGQCMLISSLPSRLDLLDKSNGDILASFKDHKNKTYRIDNGLLANDSLIVSGSEDGYIYIWSLLESKIEAKLKHPKNVAHTLCVNPSNTEMISGAENILHLWKLHHET